MLCIMPGLVYMLEQSILRIVCGFDRLKLKSPNTRVSFMPVSVARCKESSIEVQYVEYI